MSNSEKTRTGVFVTIDRQKVPLTVETVSWQFTVIYRTYLSKLRVSFLHLDRVPHVVYDLQI